MELIIIIVAMTAIIVVNLMMKINIKELEKIALDVSLNEIAKKYPKNTEICTDILQILGNKTTKIEEDTSNAIFASTLEEEKEVLIDKRINETYEILKGE